MHAPVHLGHQQRLVAQALFGQQGLAFVGQAAAAALTGQHGASLSAQHTTHAATLVNQQTAALTSHQISALPPQLHFLIQLRMASTSSQVPLYETSAAEEYPNEAPSLPPERRAPRVARARAKSWAGRTLHTSNSRDLQQSGIRGMHASPSRAFSTTPPRENAYPFPTNPRPTPHQIFHLPVTASQKEIKARYYDLVRLHHPDSHNCRHMTPAERHRRFQAITNAYDILRGKKAPEGPFDPFAAELARRKRAYAAARRGRQQSMYRDYREYAPSGDERWKDRVIVTVGVLGSLVVCLPHFSHVMRDFVEPLRSLVDSISPSPPPPSRSPPSSFNSPTTRLPTATSITNSHSPTPTPSPDLLRGHDAELHHAPDAQVQGPAGDQQPEGGADGRDQV
ncbi:hypothetical protein K523DRAFT_8770 [Schizophyllum commune Tattone D]|nr:hypothetical protein K523DRAFT_8770 [Schizophyllum commune Tattone D]